MKNYTILLTVLLIILGVSATGLAEVSFTDSSGTPITLPAPAERVVCLNSDVAEAMVLLGAGDRVVGVAQTVTTDSALMRHLPKAVSVGDWQTPSVEKTLQLKPDAVIGYSSSKPKNADQFTGTGINLIYLDCYKFDTLDRDIRELGTMTGTKTEAEKYCSFLNSYKQQVSDRLSTITSPLPTVYVEGYSDYSAQGKDSGVDILLGIARGKNLAADLGEQWPKVTPEWVISENPAVILKTASLKPDITLDKVRDAIMTRTGFEVLDAVKEERVFVLNGDLVYGPRSPAGLVYLAKALHPEECSDFSPDAVLEEYAEKFVSGTETGDYFSPGV